MRRISKSLLLLLLVGSVFGFNASNLYAQEETEKKEFTVEQYKAVTEMITALQKRVDELNKKSSDNLDEAKKYANTLASSTEQICRDLVTVRLTLLLMMLSLTQTLLLVLLNRLVKL